MSECADVRKYDIYYQNIASIPNVIIFYKQIFISKNLILESVSYM